MITAQTRGWGSPDATGFEAAHIVTVTAGGVSLRVNKSVAHVWEFVLTELAKRYPLAGKADDWGYCNRDVRGRPGVKSNHAWGFAADLDATSNPMTTDTHARHELVASVVDPILAHFGGRLIWGGEYRTSRKDYMHLEWEGTPQEAAHDNALAFALLHPAKRRLSLVKPQMHGGDVREVGAALHHLGYDVGLPADVFGPMFDKATRQLQHRAGLPITGVIGTPERNKLGVAP